MEKVSGAKANATLLAGLYWMAKMRKTTTALMAPPEFRPMAVLDTDRGAALRLRLLSMSPAQRAVLGVQEVMPAECGPWCAEGIDFYYPAEKQYFQDCYDFANRIANEYKLVVIDTASTLCAEVLAEVTRTEYSGVRDGTKRMSLQTGTRTTVHPTMGDYGVAQDRFMEFLKGLDQSKAHVLCLFHERTGEVKDAEGVKRIVAGPRTTGVALIETVPSILDVIIRLETRMTRDGAGKMGNQIVMRTRNHNGIYIAGDRSGLFKDEDVFEPAVFWKKIAGLIALSGAPVEAPKGA